ncbi:PucR family transcriptional regulator, partial [Streptomyces botrytidirepellens]
LPQPVRTRLAGEHLAARRAGRRGPHRLTAADGVTYSLFPIRGGTSGGDTGDTPASPLADWLLAVAADAGDWPDERLDLLHGVTQLIAVERDRRDAAGTVRRQLAQEVLELVQAGAPSAEVAARLRVAAPVLLPGLGSGDAPHWQVVVARLEGEPGDGPVAQALLEEILVDPRSAGAGPSDRIAVAHTGDEAVALLPLPAPTDTDADAASTEVAGHEAGLHADALLAAVGEPLARGLGDDARLTLGVSAPVHSAEALRGALEEARHARR